MLNGTFNKFEIEITMMEHIFFLFFSEMLMLLSDFSANHPSLVWSVACEKTRLMDCCFLFVISTDKIRDLRHVVNEKTKLMLTDVIFVFNGLVLVYFKNK